MRGMWLYLYISVFVPFLVGYVFFHHFNYTEHTLACPIMPRLFLFLSN